MRLLHLYLGVATHAAHASTASCRMRHFLTGSFNIESDVSIAASSQCQLQESYYGIDVLKLGMCVLRIELHEAQKRSLGGS